MKLPNGSFDSLLYSPPIFYSTSDSVERSFRAKNNHGLANRHLFPSIDYFFATSSVVGLFLGRCPSAIRWFVITIVVYALDRMFIGRAMSHIRDKILKIFPPFTYFNASSTVVCKTLAIFIVAPLSHSGPNIPIWSMGFSMLKHPRGGLSLADTST